MSFKKSVKNFFGFDPNMKPQLCFAQDGEDLILDRMLETQKNGFYVDVGAHHPLRFSNTYLFYQRGWRGINIDAEPGSMRLFNKFRPNDINIESGVSDKAGYMTYYRFNEPALNTFNEMEARLKNRLPYRIIQERTILVRRLDEILLENLGQYQQIDFLSVDVEGMDCEVLKSNDWSKFRPRFILVETLRTDLMNLSKCPVVQFLKGKGYKAVAKAYNTTFFERLNISLC